MTFIHIRTWTRPDLRDMTIAVSAEYRQLIQQTCRYRSVGSDLAAAGWLAYPADVPMLLSLPHTFIVKPRKG